MPAIAQSRPTSLTRAKRGSTPNKTSTLKNSDRLNCRIRVEVKRRAEEAASLAGQSITAFTEAALEEHAQAIFERHERLQVSPRDFSRVADLLASPPAPKQNLVAALRDYEKQKGREKTGNW